MSDEEKVLSLILAPGVSPEDYDVIRPNLGRDIRRMVRAELAHQLQLGVEDPIESAADALIGDFNTVLIQLGDVLERFHRRKRW